MMRRATLHTARFYTVLFLTAGGALWVFGWSHGTEVPPPFASLTAPTRTGPPPSKAACLGFLRDKVDLAFNENDLESLCNNLTPIHRHLYQRLVTRLTYAMQIESLVMKTRLVDYRTEGDAAILLVENTFHRKGAQTVDLHREWSYLVLHDQSTGESGDIRTLLRVTVDPSHLPHAENKRGSGMSWNRFACGWCNYYLKAPEGWLMVPHPKAKDCVEAVSFYAMDRDVTVDVSVLVGDPQKDATQILDLLLRQRLPDLASDKVSAWLPSTFTAAPDRLRGATATVASNGNIEQLHLICHGPVQYLIVSHAPVGVEPATLRSSAAAVIDSFMIRDLKLSPEQLLANVCQHSRCKMKGRKLIFKHPEIGELTLDLPTDWSWKLRTNHFLIDMACDCPSAANHIKLQGSEPPIGLDRWTVEAADVTLEKTLDAVGAHKAADTGWQQTPCNPGDSPVWDYTRRIKLELPTAEDKRVEIDLYLMMTDRILVTLQATIEDEIAAPFIKKSVNSLTFAR